MKVKLAVYKADWFDTNSGGTSFVKFAKGRGYPITEETQAHINQGHAEEVEADEDADTAEKKLEKAKRLAEQAAQKQADAESAQQLAEDAAQAAAEAQAQEQAAAQAAERAEAISKVITDQRAEMERLAAVHQAASGTVPTDSPVATRAQLDAALAALPGEYTDASIVIEGMRNFYAELFTEADEATVRDLVKVEIAATE